MRTEDFPLLEQTLWPTGYTRTVWMIVDAARDQRIFGMLLDAFYSDHTCLFAGTLPPALELAAPYLIRLEYQGPKTQRFITRAWGNGWGIFLKSDARLEELMSHLRGLLMVRAPGGQELLFRYYDPRVLRAYLPTCTPDELRTVFGPIESFWIEDADPAIASKAGLDGSQLVVERIPVAVDVMSR